MKKLVFYDLCLVLYFDRVFILLVFYGIYFYGRVIKIEIFWVEDKR